MLAEEDKSVFTVRFSFSNKPMLKLLEKRARALHSAKFDKVNKIEQKMDKLKNEKFDELRTPNRFYATFMTADAS